ncbi:MAG: PKD domain-containing protein [Bacteroidota bacterium]
MVLIVIGGDICYAQKFDNVWVMGYNYDFDIASENFKMVFDTFPPRIEIAEGKLYIDRASASICDSVGSLKLHTNNCFMVNANEEFIEGGDTLTEGWELDWCNTYWWYPFDMSNLLIPNPGKKNEILFFQRTVYNNPPIFYAQKLLYSIIDLNGSNGKGKFIEKHKVVIDNKFSYGEMTAVKHGNGMDWWLPMPVQKGNTIYLIHVTKDSVYVQGDQSLGPDWSDSGSFQAVFSPDGSRYARYNPFYGLYLYDFDRCSGELSNLRFFSVSKTAQGLAGGVCFSPNGNLLYLSEYDSLFQISLNSPDTWGSRRLVAVFDGNICALWSRFGTIFPGPDGRLYIKPPATSSCIHVINRPNLRGPACDVRQHDIIFPNPCANPQNFPNFRLGPLDGSPCDTLGFNNYPLADFRPEASDSSGLAWEFWDVSSYAPTHWLWDFGDGAMSEDTTAAHVFAAPGDYTVCLTVSNAYGVNTKCKVMRVMTTGVSGVGAEKDGVRLYPNPTTGLLRVSGDQARAYAVRVYDLNGRLVFSGKTLAGEVDLSGLSNGSYLLQVADEDGVVRRGKVVVLR